MERKADFCKGDIVKIDTKQLEDIREFAMKGDVSKRYRLCMHDSPDNILQEMFICRYKGDYCKPDKHYNMPESHTIIEGEEAIVLFDDVGEVLDVFVLSRERGYLAYRINSAIYHMTIPLSEYAIDLEVKKGPFEAKNNIFPKWAPDAEEKQAVCNFMKKVMKEINNRRG